MELQYTPIRAQWPDKDSVVTAFRYLLACPFVMGKTVLELGCGSGNGVEILSAHTKEYVGIDIEPHWGKNNSKQNSKVTFIQAEACNIPAEFEGKFDVVIALELVEHLKAPAALCSQIRKVLTPNGLAIISTPNFDLLSRRGKNSGRPLFRHHIREYKTDEFEQYLKNFEMNFCIHGLSQLSRSSDISDNLRIVFNDVLYELKVGQQFPDMEILSKQFLPKSIPLHYSQSFFAIVGSGAGQKRSFISNISQRHPEVVVTKADKSISMEDICAMSVEWILHRRNEHVSDMQDIVGDIQGVVGDRERRIVNFEKNTSDMENVILVLKEQIEQINDSKESEKRAIIKKQKNLIAQKESQLLEATKTIRDTEQKHLEYCTTIEKHIENLENIVKNREEQIEHSKKVITELDCRLKEKDTTIDAKDKTIAEKESQFKASQETVSIIRNSFSYKTGSFLTFPLRFL